MTSVVSMLESSSESGLFAVPSALKKSRFVVKGVEGEINSASSLVPLNTSPTAAAAAVPAGEIKKGRFSVMEKDTKEGDLIRKETSASSASLKLSESPYCEEPASVHTCIFNLI